MKRPIILLAFLFITIDVPASQTDTLFVYFSSDKFNVSRSEELRLKSFLDGITPAKIELNGHCDSIGSLTYNENLSVQRCLAVKKIIRQNLLKETQILINHFGERKPIDNNEDTRARAVNRRVQVIVWQLEKSDTIGSIPEDSIKESKVIVTDSDKESAHADSIISTLKDLEVGTTLRLPNLNFYPGRHVILPQSLSTLKLLLKVLNDNSKMEIEIQGHICCQYGEGDGMDNETGIWNLSLRRAKEVYDYLVQNGIKARRLSYKGFGAGHKLVVERTEEDRITNRRVEVKILKR